MAYHLTDDVIELRGQAGTGDFAGGNMLGVSREEAIGAFVSYVTCYDMSNPQIAHKCSHTLRVTLDADEIATRATAGDPLYATGRRQRKELLPGWVPDEGACFLMGLLHDLGRFPQYAMYRTYSDMASFPHAEMSYEMLGKFGMMGCFVSYPDDDRNARCLADRVLRSIRCHSLLSIDGVTGTERAYYDILRDADKTDILEAYCHAISSPDFREQVANARDAIASGNPAPQVAPADAPFVNEMARMEESGFSVSDAVVADILSNGLVDRRNIRTAGDAILSCVAMYSGIETEIARAILSERETMTVVADAVIGTYGGEDSSGTLERMVRTIVRSHYDM